MKHRWSSILTEREIADRKPVWTALSSLYLDTELQERDFEGIAKIIQKSPYSLDEVKTIDKYEVFPVLIPNLLSVAGEWAGFNEEWLVDAIIRNLPKRDSTRRLRIEIQYLLFGRMNKDYYKQLEGMYSPGSF